MLRGRREKVGWDTAAYVFSSSIILEDVRFDRDGETRRSLTSPDSVTAEIGQSEAKSL